ncbi:MAG: PAS domain-containing protein, partial [Deltaproteobacteria bacterium]|nr:PAS domain-containing protein [Deltaproteobacteria bacterium]
MPEKPTYEELEQKVRELEKEYLERKRTEELLQKSEERFRAIFDTAEDSIFIKDRHLRYTLVNPTMERLFGVPASQLLGKSDEELFGNDAGAHIREVDSCVLKGEIVEGDDTKPVSGVSKTFHVIKVPMRDSSGEIIGLCGIARDITKQNQAKEALKKAHEELEQRVKERTTELSKINDQLIQEIEERKQKEEELRKYERIVDASNDHMSLTNRNYVYQLANDAYLRSHKIKCEDIVGHSVPELFGQEFFEIHQKPMIDRCLAGEVVRYQSWIDFPTLGRRYMDIAYYPYFEDDGSIS